MTANYILGIDQSTQGTKALLFNETGDMICRSDLPHRQIVNEIGYVEHDPMEIYRNTIDAVQKVIEKSNISSADIKAVGISNQRETAVVWNRKTGKPVYNAIVWQCSRGEDICNALKEKGNAELIHSHTGLQLSPYFSAAKIAWILEHVPGVKELEERMELCCGTVDSWLVYKLTGGKEFRTDYSNASRTQLFDISKLKWDEEVCGLFGISVSCLAKVTDSDGMFGMTDFEGKLKHAIPICGVLGDSHGALFGQGCQLKGMIKTTYGTGSSVMMNIGETPVFSKQVVTSLAWKMNGIVSYVLEGNINYAGAVVTWLKDDLKLIESSAETEQLAKAANQEDKTYLVPAFTGLSAPYWDSRATAVISGITRTTGRPEIVRAGLDCIAYQITDIVKAMSEESGISIKELRVDGGPTKNRYLMQFQSDITDIPVCIPAFEELSGIGAAYTAGIAIGMYDSEQLFDRMNRKKFKPQMKEEVRTEKYNGWKDAVKLALSEKEG